MLPHTSDSRLTSIVKSKSSAAIASLNASSVGITIVPLKPEKSSISPNCIMRSAWNGKAVTKDSTSGKQHSVGSGRSAAFKRTSVGDIVMGVSAGDKAGIGAKAGTGAKAGIGAKAGTGAKAGEIARAVENKETYFKIID